MSKALLTHTQQAVVLSLNIITQDDTGFQFAIVPLLHLTGLIMFLWSFRQVVNRIHFNLAVLAQDITSRIILTRKVLAIGFTAIKWGVLG